MVGGVPPPTPPPLLLPPPSFSMTHLPLLHPRCPSRRHQPLPTLQPLLDRAHNCCRDAFSFFLSLHPHTHTHPRAQSSSVFRPLLGSLDFTSFFFILPNIRSCFSDVLSPSLPSLPSDRTQPHTSQAAKKKKKANSTPPNTCKSIFFFLLTSTSLGQVFPEGGTRREGNQASNRPYNIYPPP